MLKHQQRESMHTLFAYYSSYWRGNLTPEPPVCSRFTPFCVLEWTISWSWVKLGKANSHQMICSLYPDSPSLIVRDYCFGVGAVEAAVLGCHGFLILPRDFWSPVPGGIPADSILVWMWDPIN